MLPESWTGRLRTAWDAFRHGRRRFWMGEHRAWIEVRLLEPDLEAFAAVLHAELEAMSGVAWARLNAATSRVVVEFEDESLPIESLVATVDEVEARFGLAGRPTWRDRRAFPGDPQPLGRFATELAIDAVGTSAGLAMRALGTKTTPAEPDLAALLSVFEYVPDLRRHIERVLGPNAAELAFAVAEAFDTALLQGVVGPAVRTVQRVVNLRETTAYLEAWSRAEPRLGSRPEQHRLDREEDERVHPMPRGPIERYTSRAVAAATGAFGFSFLATKSLPEATIPVFGGMPRPAVNGREAYAAEVGRLLAGHGILIMDPGPLRLFDRIDTVVVTADLLRPLGARVEAIVAVGDFNARDARRNAMRMLDLSDPTARRDDGKWALAPYELASEGSDPEIDAIAERLHEPGGLLLALWHKKQIAALISLVSMTDPIVEALATAVRRAGFRLVCAGEHRRERGWVEPDRFVPGGDQLSAAIRALQAEGRGVYLVARGPQPAYAVADVSVGLMGDEDAVPWGACMISEDGLVDATLVVEAMRAAGTASSQSVYLAILEAASGMVLAVAGLRSKTLRRVRLAANAASLAAIVNGIRIARTVQAPSKKIRSDTTPWHSLEADETLSRLEATADGLRPSEAQARYRPPPPPPTAWSRFSEMLVGELANPFAPVLAAGAGLSALTGSVVDALLIGGVVSLNALLGAVQHYRTEQALAALDGADGESCRVRRGGEVVQVDPEELVPGDVLLLQTGESVTADARILEASGLEVDESSLTGESFPVAKNPAPSFADAVADRTSMVFEGTTIAAGSCEAVVTAVGDDTEARRALGVPLEGRRTGVEARLDALTDFTAPVAALSGVALMSAGLSRDRPPAEVISSGVSLAVAAVPEGLPLIATMAQLAAAHRLSRRGALVRNPRAVEALGRANVVCADKTGTLTENRLQLRCVGDGENEVDVDHLSGPLRAVLAKAIRATPVGTRRDLPHSTDRALLEGAAAVGMHRRDDQEHERISELPFESARGYHAVLGKVGDEHRVTVKGAPERVLPLCVQRCRDGVARDLQPQDRQVLIDKAEELGQRGLRVLAVAERSSRPRDHIADRHVVDLTFLGFVAFVDPVRDSAKQAVDDLRRAGVDVVMITGDHPSTASAIARQLELSHPDRVMTGTDLDDLGDAALDDQVEEVSVFARVTPKDKVRIVRALQRRGRIVAMTGDGVNDAPAIRLAEVGIALGPHATAAARRAADIVVTDERIETIVDAMLEGRALWRSVRDAVSLLVGGNLGEIGFTVIGGLVEGRSPLNARQLLLVNLLTDSLPALAVALRPPPRITPEEVLEEGPEASLGSALNRDLAWRATVTGGATVASWLCARMLGSRARADTVALLTLVGSQLGQTLALGGRDAKVLGAGLGSFAVLLGVVETPGLSHFFGCRPLGPIALGQAAVASGTATVVSVVAPKVTARLEKTRVGRRVRRLLRRLGPSKDESDQNESSEHLAHPGQGPGENGRSGAQIFGGALEATRLSQGPGVGESGEQAGQGADVNP